MWQALLISFTTLFSIVDPLASIPTFLAMTHGYGPERRKQIAIKAVMIATALLVLCAATGHMIFKFFGITMPAFKLAGGLLLFVVSFQMLHAQHSGVRQTAEEEEEGVARNDIAVFPLAIPLLAGPGAVASVFILIDRFPDIEGRTAVFGGILLTMASAMLILASAPRVIPYLGAIGINVMTRVMGLLLAAISMQFVLDALHEAFPKLGV